MAIKLQSKFSQIASTSAAKQPGKEQLTYEQEAYNEAQMLQFGCLSTLQKEADNFHLATDTEYWCCLCFPTREKKDEFLRKAKLTSLGDKYLDGHAAAEVLGIDLGPKPKLPSHKNSPGQRALSLVLKKKS